MKYPSPREPNRTPSKIVFMLMSMRPGLSACSNSIFGDRIPATTRTEVFSIPAIPGKLSARQQTVLRPVTHPGDSSGDLNDFCEADCPCTVPVRGAINLIHGCSGSIAQCQAQPPPPVTRLQHQSAHESL